ncbi:hypothetical protein [Haloarcula onubensis]|uniref:Uncharacterized protein n=1 Tax=Haloarcula onubensis TaxID=2950539 RepID=A0ABU2FJJ5_9EURY|nr:hypothetical protein [Halomicroarcula sp. S3CR25-11]MDS0280930.1 hypothetical protein [Halomicroarcula sp. S3CR25-11]
MEFPKASEGILPGVYDLLDDHIERVEEVLRNQFEIEERGDAEVILWGEASEQDFLEAMHEDALVMVPFFQKITGLPTREFERVYGIDGVDRIKGWSRKDLRKSERGQELADAVDDLLPAEMYLETALYSFYMLWENDQRRHERSDYEITVREYLEDQGISVKKDESIPGQPDLVIPKSSPYKVIGEVRALHRNDFRKRNKNFDSEATKAKANWPNAKFVVVAKFPQNQVDNSREELRGEVEAINSQIDAVFFPDEMDDFIEQLEDWDVNRSEPTEQAELSE